jgi:hypothetical protein
MPSHQTKQDQKNAHPRALTKASPSSFSPSLTANPSEIKLANANPNTSIHSLWVSSLDKNKRVSDGSFLICLGARSLVFGRDHAESR